MNVTLFRNRIFADDQVKMTLLMTVSLNKGEIWAKRQTYSQTEHYVKMKAGIKVMHLQANGCCRLPAKHQELGESHGTDLFFTVLRRNQPANTDLFSDF